MTWLSTEIWLTLFDQAILGIMTSFAMDFDMFKGQPSFGPQTFNNKIRNGDFSGEHSAITFAAMNKGANYEAMGMQPEQVKMMKELDTI